VYNKAHGNRHGLFALIQTVLCSSFQMGKRKTPAAAESLESSPPEAAKEYLVLARRYRPRQFASLVGQEPVAQALSNALQSGRVAHAYLFTGARGVGKTTTARILAKCLNCEKGPTTTPCDECEMCLGITAGEDVDVLEIDGASNRGIDEIREIRANVQYRPSRSRYKIYIIDEVHMLTGPAFNALLKTLEEPPPHVKFIFATTEANKIPITILSRCQRFDFAGIGMAQIIGRLEEIVTTEEREADRDALELVARRAGGSMRDAQSLLDQLLAFTPGKLGVEQVHGLLGSAGEERVSTLAQALLCKDAPQALDLLGEALDHGAQQGELLDQLIEYWRDLMITQVAGVDRIGVSVTGVRKTELQVQATQFSLDSFLAGLDVLSAARQRLRGTSHGRVLLEMAVVRLCRLENLVALSQLTEMLQREGLAVARPAAAAPQFTGPTAAGSTGGMAPAPEKKKELTPAEPNPSVGPIQFREENIDAIWQQLFAISGFILQSQLRKAASVAISGPNSLVIRYPAGYNLVDENVLDANRLVQVERLLEKVVGRPCTIQQEVLAAPVANGTVRQSGAEAPARSRIDVKEIPLIGKAMEVLAARVVSEDPEFGALPAVPYGSESEDPEED